MREIRCLVREAQREFFCLKYEDFEDLLQECLIHWFFIKDKYRADAGASERTFLNRVTRHRLVDISRVKGAYKRKSNYMSESLDGMNEEKGTNAKKEKALMVEQRVIEEINSADLPDALASAMAGLTFRQKQICRWLSEGMSLVKAGEKMGIPRTTLQEEVKRIREVFRKEGLDEYLQS